MTRTRSKTEGSQTVPFTKEAMLEEFKRIVLAIAGHVANIAGKPRSPGAVDPALAFIGLPCDEDDWMSDEPYGTEELYLARVDLNRLELTGYLEGAYDFAFQVEDSWSYDETHEQRLRWLEAAVPRTNASGTVLAFGDPDQVSPCRHVLKMAAARWWLDEDDQYHVPIDDLALLAGMTQAAVRNAFSAEGIKPQRPFANQPVGLAALDAREWLANRRGFIPTKKDDLTDTFRRRRLEAMLNARDLRGVLDAAAETNAIDRADFVPWLMQRAEIDEAVAEGLLTGTPILDVAPLERVARALHVDPPRFVAIAIETGLRARWPAAREAVHQPQENGGVDGRRIRRPSG
jgi:hypothetical protein